jgi:hypothetical protein
VLWVIQCILGALCDLSKYVQERARNYYINELRYWNDPEMVKKANDTVRIYYESFIDKITIRDKGYPTSKSFGIVLQNQMNLGLLLCQIDSFTDAAYKLRQKMKRKEISDTWVIEQPYLLRILTPIQMDKFLTIKNTERAQSDAKEMWKRIKQQKFSITLDSALIVKQISDYQLALHKINGKYLNDEKKRKQATDELLKLKPQVMEMLKIAEQNQTNMNGVSNGYIW